MKKFRWVKLTGTTDTKGKVCRDKQTGQILKGLMFDDNSDYWFGYSETTDEVDGYPITRLEVQQEVTFDLQRLNVLPLSFNLSFPTLRQLYHIKDLLILSATLQYFPL